MNSIKPQSQPGKNMTAAATDFMHQKIDERKQNKYMDKYKDPPQFLHEKKEDLMRKLYSFDYNLEVVRDIIENQGIYANEIGLVSQMISEVKRMKQLSQNESINMPNLQAYRPKEVPKEVIDVIYKDKNISHRYFRVTENFQMNISRYKKKKERYERTQEFLENLEEEGYKANQSYIFYILPFWKFYYKF